MKIIKSTGEKVEFSEDKIRASLERAGAEKDLIDRVLSRTKKRLKEGMTTKQVYSVVRKELRRANRSLAYRYNLRAALLKLGPAGYKFERYVASILNAYQYEAWVPEKDLSGLCVDHEIDVIAKKNGRTAVIEAKFRNRFGDSVNLKDTMATWARYLDLHDGAKAGKCMKFNEIWIVTNGSFSNRALQFGLCKGIHMVGWSTREHSLARMVDHATLYPMTILDDLRSWEIDRFANKGIMLCKEIVGEQPNKIARKTGLPSGRVKTIIDNCKAVTNL